MNLTIKETNIIKGISILTILCYHWWTPRPWWFSLSAFQAVGIFVILSGYGLAKSIQKNNDWKQFYKKRFYKIYPLYWFIISASAFIFYVVGVQISYTNAWSLSGFDWALLISGFHTIKRGLYWGINPAWWFVSLILQLYLIFKFVYHSVKKNPNYSLVFSIIIWLFYQFYVIAIIPSQSLLFHHNFLFVSSFIIHLPEFVFGVWLAHIQHLKKRSYDAIKVSLFTFGFILYALFLKNQYIVKVGPVQIFQPHALISISFFMLIIMLLKGIKRFGVVSLLLHYVGKYAYVIFLTHHFILKPIDRLLINHDLVPLGRLMVFVVVACLLGIVVQETYNLLVIRCRLLIKKLLRSSSLICLD